MASNEFAELFHRGQGFSRCLIAELSITINLFDRTSEIIGKSKPHPLTHYRQKSTEKTHFARVL